MENTDIRDFLETIFGVEEGYVYAPLKIGTLFEKFWFKWPEQEDDLIEYFEAYRGEGDVYMSPVLFGSENTQDFKVSRVVWCDFDDGIPGTIGDFPKPCFRVYSSGNHRKQHWYWMLSEPVRSCRLVEQYNRQLAYSLGADRGCWNFGRVLRPIGTLNHKYSPPASVSLAAVSSDIIYPHTFAALPQVSELTERSEKEWEGERYTIREINQKYDWPPAAYDFFTTPKVDGERHQALTSVAITCWEMGMTIDEVMSVLLDADDRWRKYVGRADRIRRLHSIAEHAKQRVCGSETYEEWSSGNGHFDREHSDALDASSDSTLESFERPRRFSDFVRHEFEIDWVIEGLIHQQGLAILASPPSVGKTQFSLNLAISLATGKDFLGWKVTRPRRILFLSLEMTQPELKFYLDRMTSELTAEERDLLDANLFFVAKQSFRLNGEQNQRILQSWLDAVQPEGIFIDSLSRCTGGDLEKSEVDLVFDFLNKEVRAKRNTFIWFVHHNRKANALMKQPKRLEDLYGSQYIGAYASTVVGLWKITSETIEVNCLKVWLSKPFDSFLVNRKPNLTFEKDRNYVNQTT